jgi:hypothetical protein
MQKHRPPCCLSTSGARFRARSRHRRVASCVWSRQLRAPRASDEGKNCEGGKNALHLVQNCSLGASAAAVVASVAISALAVVHVLQYTAL